MLLKRLALGLNDGLEGLGRAAALLHNAEARLNALCELLAAIASNTFDPLLHAAIGTDAEADRALDHPGPVEVAGC